MKAFKWWEWTPVKWPLWTAGTDVPTPWFKAPILTLAVPVLTGLPTR